MNYKLFDTICIRTPAYAFDENKLTETDSFFDESVFLASPVLYQENQKLNEGKAKEETKVKLSLNKYYVRASSRCTPFGTFAGISGTKMSVAEENSIVLNGRANYQRHTRLDMNYLCALASDLSDNLHLKQALKFYPNNSLYKIAGKYRYVEYFYIKARRVHQITGVDENEYLNRIVEVANNGLTISELAQIIVEDDITYEDALAFIDTLVESQILVAELYPNVSGKEQLPFYIEKLKNYNLPETENILRSLEKVNKILNYIDNNPIGDTIKYYTEIKQELDKIGTQYDEKYLFQTDMVKPVKEATISSLTITELKEAVDVLNKLSTIPSETNLTKFAQAFTERYEDKFIPLSLVLDPDIGIGYIQNNNAGDVNPLADDLFLPMKESKEQQFRFNVVQSMLLKKLKEAIALNKTEIEIDKDELKDFKSDWDNTPLTFSTMVELLGDNFLIRTAGGTSAVNLLGRFAYADKEIEKLCFQITEHEQKLRQDVIFAEIVHLPESRVGNILMRPTIREYEIPYLAQSTLPKENHIEISDLYVGVKRNKVVLWSKKHNKEVFPKLGNAHNFSANALPIYHFLCELQMQNIKSGFYINWGFIQNQFDFLPRVNYKNAILSPAKWTIKIDEIKSLLKKADENILIGIADLRNQKQIPEKVVLADGDNELFVNLKSIQHIKMLFSVIKNRPSFILEEFLFNPDKAVVKSDEGVYTNQVVFSFYKQN